MKLVITTPLAVSLETDNVVSVRAEDDTGQFGVLPGHADFLTALAVSVISWRDPNQHEHYAAVRGGMLSVEGGDTISVATPEAVVSDDIARLETEVMAHFHERHEQDRAAHVDLQRLYLRAMRQIYQYLRPEQRQGPLSSESGS